MIAKTNAMTANPPMAKSPASDERFDIFNLPFSSAEIGRRGLVSDPVGSTKDGGEILSARIEKVAWDDAGCHVLPPGISILQFLL